MTTVIRPKLSTKNKYWIEKHRYYELKHFCLQYPLWRKIYSSLDGAYARAELSIFGHGTGVSDPTERQAETRVFYSVRMKMIEQAAIATDADLYSYILEAVTEGLSYDHIKARLEIPCCKDVYYELYRRFFWLLDKERQ